MPDCGSVGSLRKMTVKNWRKMWSVSNKKSISKWKKLFWSRAEISLTDNNRSKRPKNPQKYHDRHFGLIQLWLTQIIWPRMTFTWPENMWSYWPVTLSGTFYIWKRFGITESRSCILKVSFEMDLMFKWN